MKPSKARNQAKRHARFIAKLRMTDHLHAIPCVRNRRSQVAATRLSLYTHIPNGIRKEPRKPNKRVQFIERDRKRHDSAHLRTKQGKPSSLKLEHQSECLIGTYSNPVRSFDCIPHR